MLKPVSRIFKPAKAVLIDDNAGSPWISARIGVDAIKACTLAEDSLKTAEKIWNELTRLLGDALETDEKRRIIKP